MFTQPLWFVGFRPFFTLAFASGVLLPAIWGAELRRQDLSARDHRAHRMACARDAVRLRLGGARGFLLTASKNWVHIRGLHGGPLALAALFWFLERGALFTPADGAWGPLRTLLINACVLYVGGYVVWCAHPLPQAGHLQGQRLLHRRPAGVPGREEPAATPRDLGRGDGAVDRHLPSRFRGDVRAHHHQFMKNAMGATLPRFRLVDLAIKGLVLLAAFEAVLPPRSPLRCSGPLRCCSSRDC